MNYFNFYQDIWNFHKKYNGSLINCANQAERNQVCELAMVESNEIYKKYKTQFAFNMIRDVIDELDKKEKELR